jgi:hypothetical protein
MQYIRPERVMKRIATFMLLVGLSVPLAVPAQAGTTTVEDTRQSRSAAKQQEKMNKKASRKQRKAMKKALKAQRKAQKASRHRTS